MVAKGAGVAAKAADVDNEVAVAKVWGESLEALILAPRAQPFDVYLLHSGEFGGGCILFSRLCMVAPR